MADGGRTRLQRLARWSTSSPSASMTNWSDSKKHVSEANYFQPIDHENLVQGSLYIMKVKIVTIGLFEGWNDDMCCFSVLRSDTGSMRWSEARYLPGDFDAFDAFDDAGNPPVYFWTRHLRIQVPINWFSLFEEARQRQRKWGMDVQQQYIYQQQQQNGVDDEEDEILSFPAPPSSISSLPLDRNGLGSSFSQVRHGSPTLFTNEDTANKNDTYIRPLPPSHPPASPSTTAAVAAFPTHAPKLNTNADPLVYSPVPSLRQKASATLSHKPPPRRFSQQITTDKKQDDPKKTKFSRSMSIKSLSKKRMSVFGLF